MLRVIIVQVIMIISLMSSILAGETSRVDSKSYLFLADNNYPPYSFDDENETPSGFCIDLLNRISEVMSLDIRIQSGPWDDVRRSVERGAADGLVGMFYSDERDELLDFSIPHSTIIYAIFVNDKSSIQSREDLLEKKIIVQKGDIMHDYLLENHITRSIITVENSEKAMILLATRAYDCALISKVQGDYYIKKHKIKHVKSLPDMFPPMEYCFAVNNNIRLLNKINEGLIILQSTVEYNELYQKWVRGQESRIPFVNKFLKIASIATLLLLVVALLTIFWIWSLKKTVASRTNELQEEIKHRKNAEIALRTGEENFRQLADNAFDGILICTLDGDYIYANNNAAEISGYPVEVLTTLNLKDLTPEDHYEDISKLSRERIQGKSVRSIYESLLRGKDGSLIPIEIVASRTIWHGEPADLVFIRDISLRKQMERALHSSEANFRQIVEHSNDAIYVRQNEQFVLVNPALERILEYDRMELLDPKFDFLTIVADESKAEIRKRFDNRKKGSRVSKKYEFTCKTKTGKFLELEVNTSKIFWNDKSASFGIIRDLTRYKRIQEEAFKAEKLDSIGILAGGIAHDFNNILSVLLGNVQLLKMDISDKNKVHNYLTQIEETISRATGLTQQLLTFSKGGEPIIQVASIKDLIEEVVPFALTGSNIKYDFKIEDDLRLVEIDSNQISQVLTNIVINSMQAMPNGGTVFIEAINVLVDSGDLIDKLSTGEYVKVSIRDQGVGIPEENLDKVFDPFFSTKSFGNGLGLATCYSIIGKHNGHIAVDSEPGVGTIFTFYLPSTDKPLVINKEPKLSKTFSGRIMLMDDETAVREFMVAMLKVLGFEVESAIDGESAIELFKKSISDQNPFNLVILDLTIPGGMGGKEVIKELRKLDNGITALAFSGYADDPVISQPQNFGFQASFSKPFEIDKLVSVLSSVI